MGIFLSYQRKPQLIKASRDADSSEILYDQQQKDDKKRHKNDKTKTTMKFRKLRQTAFKNTTKSLQKNAEKSGKILKLQHGLTFCYLCGISSLIFSFHIL